MRPTNWRVGDLAKQTGLSVRTLHYYDEIGLLSPSRRTDAGYRLYTARDVSRLGCVPSSGVEASWLPVMTSWRSVA